MSHARTASQSLFLLILLNASLLMGCAKPAPEATKSKPERRAESTPILPPRKSEYAPSLISPTPTPARPAPLPPPKVDQVRDAVARIFEKAATQDTSLKPGFVAGDFNGDGSEDLGVVVKASESSLGEINNEFANWTLEDPRNVPINRIVLTTRVPPRKPVRVEKGDTLLAIIHGVGPQGWRAPEAKQTYLLKNGAGSKLLVRTSEELRKASQKLPPLRGDVLNETIGGKSGFVFWTGARYAWYSSPPN